MAAVAGRREVDHHAMGAAHVSRKAEAGGLGGPLRLELVPIDSVSPDPANVRTHPERNIEAIKASLRRFGFQKPLVVDADGIIRAGNGTWTAAKALGITHVPIHRTTLRGAEATAFAIADNRTGELAEWDDEALRQQLEALQAEGLDLEGELGFSAEDVEALLGAAEEEERYTRKVEAPIYRPTGPKPPVESLVDRTKYLAMLAEIDAAELPEAEREFLRAAAARHLVFHYERVAEYYAHSEEAAKRLFENSALVIIDWDKAIELGYVKLSKRLAELYGEEYPDDGE